MGHFATLSGNFKATALMVSKVQSSSAAMRSISRYSVTGWVEILTLLEILSASGPSDGNGGLILRQDVALDLVDSTLETSTSLFKS